MKRKILLAVLTAIIALNISAQKRNRAYIEYINKYDEIAVYQMKKYKIPASITLAQGLLESGAGRSELARKSNNHFGIKCGSSWRGPSVRHDDDARNECFRAYYTPIQSYEDHSKFLRNGKRYQFLFDLKITDYRGWAKGLKKAGYATSPTYATKLIQIIEDYELYKYDRKSTREEKERVYKHEILIANGLLYVRAKDGDTFKSIGKDVGISSRKLAKYNDLGRKYPLMEGDIVYLKKKNKRYNGEKTYHTVKDGDSMHSISQTYGIRLDKLYELNAKDEEYIPTVGDKVWIK